MTDGKPALNIAVYLSSTYGKHPDFEKAAHRVGWMLHDHKVGLVYGGSQTGCMGAISKATQLGRNMMRRLDSSMNDVYKGYTHGIFPDAGLGPENLEHQDGEQYNTKLTLTKTMGERKRLMNSLADAFVVLPGSFGTLDELGDILTMRKLNHFAEGQTASEHGHFDKRIVLVNNVGGFDYAALVHWCQMNMEKLGLAKLGLTGSIVSVVDWEDSPKFEHRLMQELHLVERGRGRSPEADAIEVDALAKLLQARL